MTVRVAVVGCGAITERAHLPALRRAGADVTVFASRRLATAERLRAGWGAGVATDDWRTAGTRDDVDAVLVALPNALHATVAVEAARAGKHVLVEKPMACAVTEADAMIQAADEAGVLLMPAHNVRFAKPFVAAARLVASGRLGAVTGVRCAFGHAGPASWAPDATWFFDPELSGGGALIDLGIHAVDLLHAVLGDQATTVAAFTFGDAGGCEDAAQLVLRFGSGAIGSLHASWIARPGPDHQLTVFGTEGTMHLDGRTPLGFRPAAGGDAERVALPDETVDVAEAFVHAVRTGEPPPVTAFDGRAALAVVTAAYESARTGVTVTVPHRT